MSEDDASALAAAERYLVDGQWDAAADSLLPVLERRGDAAAQFAATLLRRRGDPAAAAPPGALAAALDRLVTLVGQQDVQIRALRAMIEDSL